MAIFHLDRLQTPAEADLIREAIGSRRRRHLSPEERERKATILERARLSKRPSNAPAFAKSIGPLGMDHDDMAAHHALAHAEMTSPLG